MPGLHLFFPENDLALAQDNASYTAPPAAVKLRRAGATLPLWYGDAGDYVIADGVNARWYNDVAGRFGLATKLYSRYYAYAMGLVESFAQGYAGEGSADRCAAF